MEKILENRRIVIRNKIVTLSNVRAMAKVVAFQLENIPFEERRKAELTFVARCDDGSSFQSADLDIFDDDSVIAQKRVTHVTLTYFYYPTKARIEVALQHGKAEATIDVSGRDRIWVAGTLQLLAGLFASFAPQLNPYLKHSRLIDFGVAMGIGSIILFLLKLMPAVLPRAKDGQAFVWFADSFDDFSALAYAIKYLVTWIVGFPWASLVTNRFEQLWPSIELQVGPDHLMAEKLRRNLLATVLVVGIIPLLLSVLYDTFKALAALR